MTTIDIISINSVWSLTLVFIVLKLCHLISWSWWFVVSPLWILIAIWTSIAILLVLGVTIRHFLDRL